MPTGGHALLKGKQCFNCGTEHHFASVCKRRDNNRPMQANGSQQFPPQYRPFRVNASNQNSKSTSSSFLAVIENPSLRARVVIQFGSTFTSAIADTGASKSFLASHVNNKLRLPLEIQQTSMVQLANGELWKSDIQNKNSFYTWPRLRQVRIRIIPRIGSGLHSWIGFSLKVSSSY